MSNKAGALSVAVHAELAGQFPEAGVIGCHGQTLAHDPAHRRTHQAGQGWRLARETGRPVVWDFRTEDVRRGGEGEVVVGVVRIQLTKLVRKVFGIRLTCRVNIVSFTRLAVGVRRVSGL